MTDFTRGHVTSRHEPWAQQLFPQTPALVVTIFFILSWRRRSKPGGATLTFSLLFQSAKLSSGRRQNFKVCSLQKNSHHMISEMGKSRKRNNNNKKEKHQGTNENASEGHKERFSWMVEYKNSVKITRQSCSHFLKCPSGILLQAQGASQKDEWRGVGGRREIQEVGVIYTTPVAQQH